jgi:DNA-binding GntR family transcriptional regulator
VSNRGLRVVSVNKKHVKETRQVRSALECLAVRLVAEKATPEQIERLGALLDRAQQRIEDGEKQYPLDLDFHDVLLLIADNALLTNMLSRIGASVRAIRT